MASSSGRSRKLISTADLLSQLDLDNSDDSRSDLSFIDHSDELDLDLDLGSDNDGNQTEEDDLSQSADQQQQTETADQDETTDQDGTTDQDVPWTDNLEGLGQRAPFVSHSGPTVVDLDFQPIDYFYLLFQEDMFETLMVETNICHSKPSEK